MSLIKNILLSLLILSLIIGLSFPADSSGYFNTVFASDSEQPYLGDVDSDNRINVSDAVSILRYIVGLHTFDDIESRQRADVNLDGKINVSDAILVLRRIVGLIDEFIPADSAVISTKRALTFVLEESAVKTVNLARDIEIDEPLIINRDITITGKVGDKKHAITGGEVIVEENVDSFTVQDINIDNLTLKGGGQDSVHINNATIQTLNVNADVNININDDSKLNQANFNSGSVTVTGGRNIANAYVRLEADVNWGARDADEPDSIVYEVLYDLTLAASPAVGGTVTGKSRYKAGEQVSLKAEASHGYRFDSWTATAGTFDDETQAETIITMPSEDVTITAEFRFTGSARFEVYLDSGFHDIWGYGWARNSQITITVEGQKSTREFTTYTGEEDYADSHVFFYRDEDFAVEPGDRVIVSDGAGTTKEHTVRCLEVTEVNPGTSTLSGKADPSSKVEVAASGSRGVIRFETEADEDGNWKAIVPGAGIEPGDSGSVMRKDNEGDATRVDWRAYTPHLIVNLSENSIWGQGWPPLGDIIISINDEAEDENSLFEKTIQSSEWSNFSLFLGNEFKINPGHRVTLVTPDGIYKKTHTVADLEVTEANANEDTVTGKSDQDGIVQVTAYADPDNFTGEAVIEDGEWIAELTEGAIESGNSGFAMQRDDEGNATRVNWRALDPHIVVNLSDKRILGNDWPSDVDITITAEDEEGIEIFTETTRSAEWIGFNFYYGDHIINAGHKITVNTGIFTKTLTVSNLNVIAVNPHNDTVSGTADAGEVHVSAFTAEGLITCEASVVDGAWEVDFRGEAGIQPGTTGFVTQRDDEGNATRVNWRALNPNLTLEVTNNCIWGHDWPTDEEITVTVEGENFEKTTALNENNVLYFRFSDHDFTVERGHVVTVTAGAYTRTHTVIDLIITEVDPIASTVSGTSDAGESINVTYFSDEGIITREATHESGEWSADFSDVDINPGGFGFVTQRDAGGNATRVDWRLRNPRFMVELTYNSIWCNDWPAEEDVEIIVNQEGNQEGKEEIFNAESDQWGNLGFQFRDHDFTIEHGDIITVTAGPYTRTHKVIDIRVTFIDIDEDTITGTGEPDESVQVSIFGDDGVVTRNVTADADGEWTADFSQSVENSGENSTYDIQPGTAGFAAQQDDAGNETRYNWRLRIPSFTVDLGYNQKIRGTDWPANKEITITVNEGEEIIEKSNEWGFFEIVLDNAYTIKPDDIVTVTAEQYTIYTKTHEVRNIEFTAINSENNTFSGKAEPDSDVRVILYVGEDQYTQNVTVNDEGIWEAVFSEGIIKPGITANMAQLDEDGNATYISWPYRHPTFAVVPDFYNYISGDCWTPNTTITVKVFEDGDKVFETEIDSDELGEFEISLEFELEPGHEVTVTDGKTERSHVVRYITVDGFDDGVVNGKVEKGGMVEIIIIDENQFNVFTKENEEFTLFEDDNWALDLAKYGYDPNSYLILAVINDIYWNATIAFLGNPELLPE